MNHQPIEQPRRGRRARTEADVAISRTVAANVARLRQARGLSVRAFSAAIQANGHRMNHSSLFRIEVGYNVTGGLRPITVDELVWLAEALGVGPDRLLTTGPCPTCADTPPNGFACRDCGAGADRE